MKIPPGWLEIGRIVGAHGLDGEVRVYPDSDFPERFEEPGERWVLKPGTQQPTAMQLQQGRYQPGKGLYLLKFAGIRYRDQAEALRDSRLIVPEHDRLPLAPNEFHVADLVGLAVIHQTTGETVGVVEDVFSAGNDLLEVTLARPGEKVTKVLIPFVEAIVPVVDLVQRRIEITPPAGLIPEG
jgi:16S rRNA processing protein RimM